MTQIVTPTSNSPQDRSTQDVAKPLPAWISILLILLCLTGGGWIMHWYITTDPLNHESHVLDATAPMRAPPPPRAPRANGGTVVLDNQPTIRQQGNNEWVVRSPEATLLVQQIRGKAPTIRSLNYNNYEFVPQEERTLIFSARRIIRDEAVIKSLKLTPEQVDKLRPLTAQVSMVVSDADSARITSLWSEYQAAGDKQSAQGKLFNALTEVARNSLEPTRQAAGDHASKIKGALTDDQWKQFEAMGR